MYVYIYLHIRTMMADREPGAKTPETPLSTCLRSQWGGLGSPLGRAALARFFAPELSVTE